MPRWRLARVCVENDPFEIAPGINVWDHEWIDVKRDPPLPGTGDEIADLVASFETARVKDPRYGQDYDFQIYEIVTDTAYVRFAAGEFSANMWGFYVVEAE